MSADEYERALVDFGARIARHASSVRDHTLDADASRVTVVELGPLAGAPAVHYIDAKAWERRRVADGRVVYHEDAGVYVVRELRVSESSVLAWGAWPNLITEQVGGGGE